MKKDILYDLLLLYFHRQILSLNYHPYFSLQTTSCMFFYHIVALEQDLSQLQMELGKHALVKEELQLRIQTLEAIVAQQIARHEEVSGHAAELEIELHKEKARFAAYKEQMQRSHDEFVKRNALTLAEDVELLAESGKNGPSDGQSIEEQGCTKGSADDGTITTMITSEVNGRKEHPHRIAKGKENLEGHAVKQLQQQLIACKEWGEMQRSRAQEMERQIQQEQEHAVRIEKQLQEQHRAVQRIVAQKEELAQQLTHLQRQYQLLLQQQQLPSVDRPVTSSLCTRCQSSLSGIGATKMASDGGIVNNLSPARVNTSNHVVAIPKSAFSPLGRSSFEDHDPNLHQSTSSVRFANDPVPLTFKRRDPTEENAPKEGNSIIHPSFTRMADRRAKVRLDFFAQNQNPPSSISDPDYIKEHKQPPQFSVSTTTFPRGSSHSRNLLAEYEKLHHREMGMWREFGDYVDEKMRAAVDPDFPRRVAGKYDQRRTKEREGEENGALF